MEIERDALTAIRERSGFSKSKLAVAAGISLQYLCDLESGHRKGSNPAIAKALAEALAVPVTAITRQRVA